MICRADLLPQWNKEDKPRRDDDTVLQGKKSADWVPWRKLSPAICGNKGSLAKYTE
jgi:hypothetical protein